MEHAKNSGRSARQTADAMHYRKNKYAAPVGGLYIFLMVVGVIALVIFCVNFTRGMLDNTGEKEKFEQVITPVVMFDPPPFEKPADADPLFLLQSALWSTLLGEKRESYKPDELEYLQVPSSDVDVASARLFGPEVKLQHQTFGDNVETTYRYDEETKTYHVPVTGQIGLYSPSVISVVKKGDVFTLEVGYIPPSNAWTQATAGKSNRPASDKEMLYELIKVKGYYQLAAIRDVPVESGDPTVALPLIPAGEPLPAQNSQG